MNGGKKIILATKKYFVLKQDWFSAAAVGSKTEDTFSVLDVTISRNLTPVRADSFKWPNESPFTSEFNCPLARHRPKRHPSGNASHDSRLDLKFRD